MLSVDSARGPWPWPRLMTCKWEPRAWSMPSPNLREGGEQAAQEGTLEEVFCTMSLCCTVMIA